MFGFTDEAKKQWRDEQATLASDAETRKELAKVQKEHDAVSVRVSAGLGRKLKMRMAYPPDNTKKRWRRQRIMLRRDYDLLAKLMHTTCTPLTLADIAERW